LNEEDEKLANDLIFVFSTHGYLVKTGSIDQRETDYGNLITDFCKNVGIDKEDYIYALFDNNLTEPVNMAIFYGSDIPPSLISLCDNCSIPYINLQQDKIKKLLLEHSKDVVGFIETELNHVDRPHGLCLSLGFIPF
jgi:hypothetical protein